MDGQYRGDGRRSKVRIDNTSIILDQHCYSRQPSYRGPDSRYAADHSNPIGGRTEPRRPAHHAAPPLNQRRPGPSVQEKPLPWMPSDVTPLNHVTERRGGAISTLGCLPDRLKVNKYQRDVTSAQRIYKLSRENEHLRQELSMYKDTHAAMRKLQDKTRKANAILRDILRDISRRLALSEERLLKYWDIHIDGDTEEMHVFWIKSILWMQKTLKFH